VKARKPIPLRFFLEAPLDSAQSFADAIIKSCGERAGLRWAQLSDEDVMIIKEKYYNVFKNLDGYTVQCDILSHTVIERESSEKDETHETTSLEILFNRLNTGGTRISQHDLNYSAIKAYWPDIKKVNDTIAKRYMPPSKLVMLAFRLALTKMDSSKGLCNPLSVRQIRTLAMNSEAKDCINRVYDHLDDIMKRIDEWLYVYDGQTNTDPERMPAYIRTSIAHKSPEVFLLLMYLASEDLDKRMQISPSEVRGLALLLHWFSLDQKNAVGVVFGNIHSGGNEEMTLRLRKALSECTGKNLLLPVFSPDEMHQFIQIKANPDWNPWSAKDYAPWYDFYSRISVWSNSEAQEMLLYAQRTFINTHFCLYDPAREDMWGEYNRPWDYDHIIPQNWIRERGRARREFRDYCSHWVNRIGNIAAIPFEDNRSKGDRDSYNVYENNADALLFDKAFLDLSKLGAKLTENSEGSYRFAEVIFKRTLDIYRQCYALFDALLKETSLTDLQARRREMMEALALRLDGAETVYVAGNGDARGGGLWRDYPIMRDADWAREWLSVGVRRRDKYFICWAWGCKKNYFEIGVRKLPGRDIEMDTSDLPEMDPSYRIGRGHWWYAYKEMSEDTNEEKIFDEIKSILTRFRTED
ncbi:MAG: hypothetical protein QM221_04690, partial [Bacillota bacterium]|nr:hypothetical protein [Bacillota bacterium]